MAKCATCFVSFDAFDMESPNGEYLESCEARTKSGVFPADLPKFAQKNPHAFCSADCEQEATDNETINRIEDQRLVAAGVYETPELEIGIGSYAG